MLSDLARRLGAHVTATTRQQAKMSMLSDLGADRVFIDDGQLSASSFRFDKVLELVGTTTLEDSLNCADKGGVVCMAGMVGGKWSLDTFAPMDSIPNRVFLTTYSGEPEDFLEMPLQTLVDDVASGVLKIKVGKVFRLDQIVEAHACMERNDADGKIVVVLDPVAAR